MRLWLHYALCKDLHSDFFFPPTFEEGRTTPDSQYYEIAKMVCEQCSVRDSCLKEAVDIGVWGGTTPRERRTGVTRLPANILPAEYIRLLPRNVPDTHVSIPQVKEILKPFMRKRTSCRIPLLPRL